MGLKLFGGKRKDDGQVRPVPSRSAGSSGSAAGDRPAGLPLRTRTMSAATDLSFLSPSQSTKSATSRGFRIPNFLSSSSLSLAPSTRSSRREPAPVTTLRTSHDSSDETYIFPMSKSMPLVNRPNVADTDWLAPPSARPSVVSSTSLPLPETENDLLDSPIIDPRRRNVSSGDSSLVVVDAEEVISPEEASMAAQPKRGTHKKRSGSIASLSSFNFNFSRNRAQQEQGGTFVVNSVRAVNVVKAAEGPGRRRFSRGSDELLTSGPYESLRAPSRPVVTVRTRRSLGPANGGPGSGGHSPGSSADGIRQMSGDFGLLEPLPSEGEDIAAFMMGTKPSPAPRTPDPDLAAPPPLRAQPSSISLKSSVSSILAAADAGWRSGEDTWDEPVRRPTFEPTPSSRRGSIVSDLGASPSRRGSLSKAVVTHQAPRTKQTSSDSVTVTSAVESELSSLGSLDEIRLISTYLDLGRSRSISPEAVPLEDTTDNIERLVEEPQQLRSSLYSSGSSSPSQPPSSKQMKAEATLAAPSLSFQPPTPLSSPPEAFATTAASPSRLPFRPEQPSPSAPRSQPARSQPAKLKKKRDSLSPVDAASSSPWNRAPIRPSPTTGVPASSSTRSLVSLAKAKSTMGALEDEDDIPLSRLGGATAFKKSASMTNLAEAGSSASLRAGSGLREVSFAAGASTPKREASQTAAPETPPTYLTRVSSSSRRPQQRSVSALSMATVDRTSISSSLPALQNSSGSSESSASPATPRDEPATGTPPRPRFIGSRSEDTKVGSKARTELSFQPPLPSARTGTPASSAAGHRSTQSALGAPFRAAGSPPPAQQSELEKMKARHKAEVREGLKIARDLNSPLRQEAKDSDSDDDVPLSALSGRNSPARSVVSGYHPPSTYQSPSHHRATSSLSLALPPPGVDPVLYHSLPVDQKLQLQERAAQLFTLMQSQMSEMAKVAKAESEAGWDARTSHSRSGSSSPTRYRPSGLPAHAPRSVRSASPSPARSSPLGHQAGKPSLADSAWLQSPYAYSALPPSSYVPPFAPSLAMSSGLFKPQQQPSTMAAVAQQPR